MPTPTAQIQSNDLVQFITDQLDLLPSSLQHDVIQYLAAHYHIRTTTYAHHPGIPPRIHMSAHTQIRQVN